MQACACISSDALPLHLQEENLGKRFMHITNFAVNRQNGRRSSSADPGVLNDTKWSLSDLR